MIHQFDVCDNQAAGNVMFLNQITNVCVDAVAFTEMCQCTSV